MKLPLTRKGRSADVSNEAFMQALVLRNPISTHADQGKRRIAELKNIFGDEHVTVVDTVPGGVRANKKLLVAHADLLGPRTLLCIAAGDGTINMVIEALVSEPSLSDAARKTPILPLWCGNANDLAHMLNGVSYRAHIRDLLAKGEVVAVHPLACQLTPPKGRKQTRIAACYASFGATAFAATKLNEPQIRNHPLHRLPGGRFVNEFLTGFSALIEAPTFMVKEEGSLKVVYERTFANGSRFAKIERLPIKLTDSGFFLSTLEDKRFVSALPRVAEIVQKRFSSKFIHDHADFTVEQTTLVQFDGETAEIIAGTKVSVTLSETPFYALSTLLVQ